jgi:Electron transfer DM13
MDKKIKIGIISAIAIIIGLTAFYLASPLFISTEINEPLPKVANVPTPPPSNQFQEFMAMSEGERIEAGSKMNEQEKNKIMLEFAKINASIDESRPQTNHSLLLSSQQQTTLTGNESSDLLLTGSFIGVGDGIHDAMGIARVIPVGGGENVLRLEDLVVTNGPDLYVYLSIDKSAFNFVNLGRLKANIGNQNYLIPAGTDMTKYDTVLIWCRAFSVLFGSADLK